MSFPEPENDQETRSHADRDVWAAAAHESTLAQAIPCGVAWLNPQRISVLSQRRKRMQRIIVLAATTAAVICVWLGLSHFDTNGTGAVGICANRGANRKG